MIEIDGSIGEGGGSVLRLSTALASLIQEPIRVYNIRARRDNPGLRPQHLKGLRALSELCSGELEGAELNSKEITLYPGTIEGRKIEVNIETAGSIGLVLQSLMIPASFSNDEVEIEFEGGASDTFYAPPIDYLTQVTLPILGRMGYRGEIELIRRGHYPKGGGKVRGHIRPSKKLRALELTQAGEVDSISGISHCVKLPSHIAKRQAHSAERVLQEEGYSVEIGEEFYQKSEDPHLGPGTGIVLWAKTESGAILGSSSLGKKGKSAERVGEEAAKSLAEQLKTGCGVDRWLTDQLVPYLALADGKSEITSAELTSHTMTNVELIKRILGVGVEIKGKKGTKGEISIKGKELNVSGADC